MESSIARAFPAPAGINSVPSTSSNETDGSHLKVTLPDGHAPVRGDNLVLAQKLRDGNLESLQEFAASLGLTDASLKCLVGVFSPMEAAENSPKQYSFELCNPSTDTLHTLCFNGQHTLQIKNGHDGKLIKQQFKRHGIPYRRDVGIDDLCKNFSSLSAKRQRKELAARFGAERERLIALAMPAWFWQPRIDKAALAEKIRHLAAQGQPIPLLSNDLDAAETAAAYGAACQTLLDEQSHEANAVEHCFLKELKQLCDDGLQADKLQESADRQKAQIQIAAIHAYGKQFAFFTDTRTNFDTPWRTELGALLARNPKSEDWKGPATMKDHSAQLQQSRADGWIARINKLMNSASTFYAEEEKKLSVLTLGRVPRLEAEAKKVELELDKGRKEVEQNIKSLLANYKQSRFSVRALNCWLGCGFGLLSQHAMHAVLARGTGVWTEYAKVNAKGLKNQLSASERDVVTAELTRWMPEAITSDFMPKTAIYRDLYEAMCKLDPAAPPAFHQTVFTKRKTFETVFSKRVPELRAYLRMEQSAANGQWIFQLLNLEKGLEYAFENVKKALGEPAKSADANTPFVSAMNNLMTYAAAQLLAIEVLGAQKSRSSEKVTREKVVAVGRNIDTVAEAFRELSNAYVYLRESAGQSLEDDQFMAVIARYGLILETSAFLARCIAPEYKSGCEDKPENSAGTSAAPGGQTDELYIPEKIDIDSIQQGQDDVPAEDAEVPSENTQDSTQSSVADPQPAEVAASSSLESTMPLAPLPLPNAALKVKLDKAQAHVDAGKQLFARIDGSPSQANNLLLASSALTEFKKGRDLFTELVNTIDNNKTEHPPGFPESTKLKTQLDLATFWKDLTHSLFSTQRDRLLYPTAATAVEKLANTKGACVVQRPATFVHTFGRTDPQTGVVSEDRMIELEIKIYAAANEGKQSQKKCVQTMLLHCHIVPNLPIDKDTPADLKKIKAKHIKAVHLKPLFYRVHTNRTAPVVQTESGARQRAEIPYCPVPRGTAINWLNVAASKA